MPTRWMERNQNGRESEAATDEHASPSRALPDFEPVPLRYRTDGLTPARQREYVEALADTGVAREAAARIGVSEQAVNRVRRRADARAFDLACEAAQRFGARRLRSIAYERAIEGVVKRHYYHGELKSEETVFDTRLLIYLLGKAGKWLEPTEEEEEVAEHWEAWADAVERGLPEPELDAKPAPVADPEPAARTEDETFDRSDLWEDEDGAWWTSFPPPEGFEGEEDGLPGEPGYGRRLSAAEQAVVDGNIEAGRAEAIARGAARRDRFFAEAGRLAEAPAFSSQGSRTL